MIIVFADMGQQTFKFYTEQGLSTIPFADLDTIKELLNDNEIMYVTNAMKVDIEDLVNFANQNKNDATLVHKETGPILVHSTGPGCLYLSEVEVTFKNPQTFYVLENIKSKNEKTASLIDNLLKNGQLEKVSSSRAEEIKRQYKRKQDIIQQKQDEELARRSTDSRGSGQETAMSGEYDAIPIDLEKQSFGSKSEANEGRMLPKDLLE